MSLSRSQLTAACIALISPFLIAADVPAPGDTGGNDVAERPATDLATLVTELGAESFTVREKAMATLWHTGKPALEALRGASLSGDPEVSARADELILYISAGVLPDSPEEIKQLVIEFSRSAIEGKLVILRKLMELSQWGQVLHLANMEQDPDSRSKMADLVQISASQASREAIVKGDLKLAAEILDLTGDDEKNMAMRAWFYVRQGLLKEKLDQAAAMPGKKGAIWRMSLHRASGNVKAAIKEADLAGANELASGMRVFTGDAIPWLTSSENDGQVSAILGLSYQIQKARLLGQTKQADVIARELVRMANDSNSASQVAVCLAANGYSKDAVSILSNHDVNTAFDYYDNIESPERCLELLGIDKDAKPPYTEWVAKMTKEALSDANDEDEYYDRLLILAGFLHRHGQGEHSMAVMSPLMKALEDNGADAWFDLLPQMRVFDLGWMAVKFIENRGNVDGQMDLGVKKMLGSDSSGSIANIWAAVKKRHPNDLNKALHEIALLAGIIEDPKSETGKIHQALLAEVQGPDADAEVMKDLRAEALYAFAINRNEFNAAYQIAEIFIVENPRWKDAKTFLDSALNRWAELEPVYGAFAKEKPGDFLNLTKWSIALRKLGKDKEAAKLYQRAMMLTMGDAAALGQIGAELSSAGYDAEAIATWEHSAIMSSSNGTSYQNAILYLVTYGQDLYDTKQWKKAGAISEVYTRLLMRGRNSNGIHRTLRGRFYADFCHSMVLLENGKRDQAIAKLDDARKLIPGDGSLADAFFPALRNAGIDQHYNRWFEDSYSHVNAACQLYPKSHNSRNTIAWLAARAVRRLDDAERHSAAALKIRPHQGAYLDTMAEVWFAKGNRKKAVEWSKKAVASSITHAQGSPRTESQVVLNFNQLNKQLERFEKAPIPR